MLPGSHANKSRLVYLLGDPKNIQPAHASTAQALWQELQTEYDRHLMLDWALFMLDAGLSDGLRCNAAASLSGKMADAGLMGWLNGVFAAQPLPESADVKGMLLLLSAAGPESVAHWLVELQAQQPVYLRLRDTFDAALAADGTANAERALAAAVDKGCFINWHWYCNAGLMRRHLHLKLAGYFMVCRRLPRRGRRLWA